jgi:hypothetical protein
MREVACRSAERRPTYKLSRVRYGRARLHRAGLFYFLHLSVRLKGNEQSDTEHWRSRSAQQFGQSPSRSARVGLLHRVLQKFRRKVTGKLLSWIGLALSGRQTGRLHGATRLRENWEAQNRPSGFAVVAGVMLATPRRLATDTRLRPSYGVVGGYPYKIRRGAIPQSEFFRSADRPAADPRTVAASDFHSTALLECEQP